VIKPHLDNRLTQASSEYITGYGMVKSGWKTTDQNLTLDVEIPVNTKATIFVPSGSADMIAESGKPLAAVKEISVKGEEPGYVKVEVGSGKYSFTIKK
jgi:alpha-L-rhamnosidase